VIGSGVAVLGLSYFAAYLLGKNAAQKEIGRHRVIDTGRQPDRLDRIERAVDSIAVEVERVAEGQRFGYVAIGRTDSRDAFSTSPSALAT
jgi:hypothetical protein